MKFSTTLLFLAALLSSQALLPAQDKKPVPAAPAVTPSKEAFQAAGEKLLAKLEEFATVLDTAKTKATAEAAKPKLGKINQELATLSQAAQALGDPPPAIKKELDENPKMQDRAQVFVQKLTVASQRIAADPDLLSLLQQTMKDFKRVTQPPARFEK